MLIACAGSHYISTGQLIFQLTVLDILTRDILETVALRDMTTGGWDVSGCIQVCYISLP